VGLLQIIIPSSNGHGSREKLVELAETIKSCRGKCIATEQVMKG